MKCRLYAAAAVMLAASLVVSHAQSSESTSTAKKHHVVKREKKPAGPTVEEQIENLRNQMQTQIDSLKSSLSEKDAQLQQAQQAAADAQAAAAKAQQAVDAQQQSDSQNAAAVSTLQSTVSDLKGNQASLATTISDETSAIKKSIESPDALHYKGITLSPAGSFLAAETVWRSSAMGDGLNTHFSSIPLNAAQNAQIGEWQGSGRQSRVALKAVGKTANFTMTGYYEADWPERRRHVQQQPVQQLHAAPAPIVGRCQNQQRLGLLRRPGMVTGYGNHRGTHTWQRNSAGHHRPPVRSRLCLDAAVQLPREQGLRQQALHRRLG